MRGAASRSDDDGARRGLRTLLAMSERHPPLRWAMAAIAARAVWAVVLTMATMATTEVSQPQHWAPTPWAGMGTWTGGGGQG